MWRVGDPRNLKQNAEVQGPDFGSLGLDKRPVAEWRETRDAGEGAVEAAISGALSAGIIADLFGMAWAIGLISALTFVSGAIVALVMREKKR
jgi:hypothetical protein